MPKKPVYKKNRGRKMRVWHDLTEIHKASREELRAWLWQNDPNGEYDDEVGEDPLSKTDMAYMIVLSQAGTPNQISPGPRHLWPAWFVESWTQDRGVDRRHATDPYRRQPPPAVTSPSARRFSVKLQQTHKGWKLHGGKGIYRLEEAKKEAQFMTRKGYFAAVFDGRKKVWEPS